MEKLKVYKDRKQTKLVGDAIKNAVALRKGAKNIIIIIEDADGIQHIINAPLTQRDGADMLLFLEAYIKAGYYNFVEE